MFRLAHVIPSITTRRMLAIALAVTACVLLALSLRSPLPPGAPRADPSRLAGVQTLTDGQMQAVRGGWLVPKARICITCREERAKSSASAGKGPENYSPSLDATTADVSDNIGLLSVGAPGTGLSVALTYHSDLADGTNTILATTMGAGWTHTYDNYLVQSGGNLIAVQGNSQITRFTGRRGTYATSTGQFVELTRPASDRAEIRSKDGTVQRFVQRDVPWQPAGAAFVLDSVVDPNQLTTQFTYDAGGLLTRVTDPFGNAIDFAYTPDGKLSRVGSAGREAAFEYNSHTGQLSAVVLPGGGRIEYAYNFTGQMTAKKVPGGGVYSVEYNAAGKADRLRDAAGATVASQTSTTNWAVDRERSLLTGEMIYVPGTVTVIDGRSNQWQHAYNDRSNIVRTLDPDGQVTTIEYDAATLLAGRIVDANGHATVYAYDGKGNRTLSRDAELNDTVYQYEPIHNRMVRRIEPDGDQWLYVYDAAGNLVEEIDPLIEAPVDATLRYQYYPNGLLWRQIDRNGNTTTSEYFPDGNVSRMVDPAGGWTAFTYDPFGNVATRTVHNSGGDQVTTYAYDSRDRVVMQTDPVGTTTRYEYDSNGDRTAEYRAWVNNATFRSLALSEYDHRSRLTRMVEDAGGLGRTTQYQYDGNDNRTLHIDPRGVVTRFSYDRLNRLGGVLLDPAGLALLRQYQYDPAGNKMAETDPNGHTTTYAYDALNRLRTATNPLGQATQYHYFAPGGGGGGCACGTPGSSLIRCMINAEGKVTRYQYDQLDRRIREIRQVGVQDCNADPDAGDAVTTHAYDPNGNRVGMTDPNGNSMTAAYTVRNELRTMSNGAGETTEYLYDPAGNRIEERRPNGNIVHSVYDADNRLTRVHDSVGEVMLYTYDAVGNRTSSTDALEHATIYAYDNLDRLVTVTDPMGNPTRYEYDPSDNRTRVVDREGNQSVTEYDAAGRRTASTVWPLRSGAPAITRYAYDPAGNLVRITDANGNATAYTYDAADRRIAETYADGTTPRYTYNGVGNVLTREDHMGEGPNPGNITTYTYDDLHRLVRRQYADGSADVFAYDRGGRMLSADNAHSHTGFAYDAADRVLTSTQTDLPQTYSYTLGYTYNVAAGTRTLTYPSGKVVTETRDGRDRLISVADAAGSVAAYAYDAADRVLTKTFGNGTQARYAYNPNDWITELRHVAPDGVTTFAGFAHDYDREGNRLNARNLQQSIPYDDAKPVTHSEKYAYDDIYRLTDYRRGQWVAGDIAAPRRQRTWTLDPVHNWRRFSIRDLGTGEDATYCNSVNQMNEYDDPSTDGPPPVPDDDGLADDFMVSPCPARPPAGKRLDASPDLVQTTAPDRELTRTRRGTVSPPAGPSGSGFNQAHDKNGNLVDDGVREYFYDHDHRPVGVATVRTENRLTMVKDKASGMVLGQYWYDALGRRIRTDTSQRSTVFVLSPGWHEVEEFVNGASHRSSVYGDRIDELLAFDIAASGQRLFAHGDALPSVLALTDSDGAPQERFAFDAFGSPSFADGSGISTPASAGHGAPLFSYRTFDESTQQYYFRRRWLDPIAGRFGTRDPMGEWLDGLNAGNAYAYAGGSPRVMIDPFGLITGSLNYDAPGKVPEEEWTGEPPNVSTGVTECAPTFKYTCYCCSSFHAAEGQLPPSEPPIDVFAVSISFSLKCRMLLTPRADPVWKQTNREFENTVSTLVWSLTDVLRRWPLNEVASVEIRRANTRNHERLHLQDMQDWYNREREYLSKQEKCEHRTFQQCMDRGAQLKAHMVDSLRKAGATSQKVRG